MPAELTADDFISENDDTEIEQELPASTDEQLPDDTADDDLPPEEPEAELEQPSEIDELREQMKALQAREERYLALLEKTGQSPAPASQPEQEVDVYKILEDTFEGETLAAMKGVVGALEKRYARAADVQQYQQTTQSMALKNEESQTMAEFVSKGVPQTDVDEAHRRIYQWARENPGRQNPEWSSPRAAFRDVLNDIMIERNYAKADAAVARKAAVKQRQAKVATPAGVTPSGSGKVKVDVLELRKRLGRKPTTQELIEEAEKAD